MSKPKWEEAPKWANWLAMDANLDWHWFEDKPRTSGKYWYGDDDKAVQYCNVIGEPYVNRNAWKDSVEERPNVTEQNEAST